MHVLLMLLTMARAATPPPFCVEDLSTFPLSLNGKDAWLPKNFKEGALRPGLMRFRDDMCRCLPRLLRHRPDLVKASLHVQPNKGAIRIEYTIDPPWSRQESRMLDCMGKPMMTVESMPYKSDMIFPDGEEEVFPSYPIWAELDNEPHSKRRLQRKN